MVSYDAKTRGHLLDIVGASNPNSQARGPVVVTARLWDGRVVRATYYRDGPKYQHPDAEVKEDIFYKVAPLVPLVERLLATGESFVTVTGSSDTVCCLEWSIAAE